LQLARQFPGEAQFQFVQSKTFSRAWKSKTKINRVASVFFQSQLPTAGCLLSVAVTALPVKRSHLSVAGFNLSDGKSLLQFARFVLEVA
jgi:hypothetical protein